MSNSAREVYRINYSLMAIDNAVDSFTHVIKRITFSNDFIFSIDRSPRSNSPWSRTYFINREDWRLGALIVHQYMPEACSLILRPDSKIPENDQGVALAILRVLARTLLTTLKAELERFEKLEILQPVDLTSSDSPPSDFPSNDFPPSDFPSNDIPPINPNIQMPKPKRDAPITEWLDWRDAQRTNDVKVTLSDIAEESVHTLNVLKKASAARRTI